MYGSAWQAQNTHSFLAWVKHLHGYITEMY